MTKYLGTIEHNARCFSCLRPDHVDVYDEHVARVDYDALDQQLAEAMDKIRTQGEQYMEMYQLNSDARTRLAEAERLLREVHTKHWPFMVDGLHERVYDFLNGAEDSADPVIHAQHDETGRMWTGPRSQLPRRYAEVSAEDAPEKCLDCGKTIDLCGCAL